MTTHPSQVGIQRRLRHLAVVAACLGALGACASGGSKKLTTATAGSTTSLTTAATSSTDSTAAGTTPSTQQGQTTTTRAAQTTTTFTASVVTATEAMTTVTVRRGDTLKVVLASTYWSFQTPTNTAVLSAVGAPVVVGTTPCIPGGGCGTASATYAVKSSGHSTITATRTSCGEAMRCTGSSGTYMLTVTVL